MILEFKKIVYLPRDYLTETVDITNEKIRLYEGDKALTMQERIDIITRCEDQCRTFEVRLYEFQKTATN